MPLGLGLGLGLQKPTLPPVSAWPTIADIPQGAPVLDTDGVVKQCRYVFRNDGTDYINLGRPAPLISLLSPGTSSKTMAIVRPTNVQDAQSIVAIAGSLVAEKQMQLSIYQLFFEGYSCGVPLGKLAANDFAGLFFNLAIINSGATARIELNKSVYGAAQMLGQSVYGGSIYIGGRTDGISTNFNGDTAFVAFYDGSGSLVDAFDPNRNDLWDGGPTGYTVMGYPFTVTDGAPAGCRAKALVPVSML